MVMANTERVAKALDLLRDGLGPACEDTWRRFYGDGWLQQVNSKLHNPERNPTTEDAAFLFKGIKVTWNEVFGHGFPAAVRSLVFEVPSATQPPKTRPFCSRASRSLGTRCSATGSRLRCARWCSRWPTCATGGRTRGP